MNLSRLYLLIHYILKENLLILVEELLTDYILIFELDLDVRS